MKIKVIESGFLRFLIKWIMRTDAITVFPFIVFRKKPSYQEKNAEMIRLHQQKELWVVGYFITYMFYWVKCFVHTRSIQRSHRNNPLTREVNFNKGKFIYHMRRKRFGWTRYRRDPYRS